MKQENVPELSHLQFAVLGAIGVSQMRGKELRKALAAEGIKKGGPAFYQLMDRLETAKFVDGWYEQKVIDGQIIKERWYRVTTSGRAAVSKAFNFYRNFAPGFAPQAI
jgi:DNA-binding PadR family transcriptional regulator